MTHFTKSFSWAQKDIQKTKNMIESIRNKMKKEMKFSIIKQTSILALNETILTHKWLVKIVSSLRQQMSKESYLIKIEKKIMLRFRVNLLIKWSISRRLINENKRREFINFHNSFFLFHFFDLLLLITK